MPGRLGLVLLSVSPIVIVLVAGVILLVLRSGGGGDERTPGLTAEAALVSPAGDAMGVIRFLQTADGVLVIAEVNGLAPGGHAFIIHEVGACTPDFAAAGDHFDPTDADHGFIHGAWQGDDSGGGHGGDLPNIYAASDGSARADFFTVGVTLDTGPRHSLFDDDGSAIIVPERADTYGEGEADTGERVACGVIRGT